MIELHEDDPDAMRAVLSSFYGYDPVDGKLPLAKCRSLQYFIELYSAADKYGLPTLRNQSADHLRRHQGDGVFSFQDVLAAAKEAQTGNLPREIEDLVMEMLDGWIATRIKAGCLTRGTLISLAEILLASEEE